MIFTDCTQCTVYKFKKKGMVSIYFITYHKCKCRAIVKDTHPAQGVPHPFPDLSWDWLQLIHIPDDINNAWMDGWMDIPCEQHYHVYLSAISGHSMVKCTFTCFQTITYSIHNHVESVRFFWKQHQYIHVPKIQHTKMYSWVHQPRGKYLYPVQYS